MARVALRARLSAVELSFAADQLARATNTAATHENRARYPLEVFRAMRAVWPADADVGAPLVPRLDAGRQHAGGRGDLRRTVQGGRRRLIDCSSGQVSKGERPVYGRLFQTPFSDKIRNEAHVDTIAVGAISEADHANSIIAAGRADLCAIARPHLADPPGRCTRPPRSASQISGLAQAILFRPKAQYEANLERAAAAARPGRHDGRDRSRAAMRW